MRSVALLGLAVLGGCTLGPEYRAPPNVTTLPGSFARATAGAQVSAPPADGWWHTLADPTLDTLIRRGLAVNADVAAAQGRLRQARAAMRLDRANRLPNGNASALYLHGELPPTNLGAIGTTSDGGQTDNPEKPAQEAGRTSLDFYNVGFDASWEVDIFGGKRRTVEASRAAVEAAEARIADVQVSLSAEIARAYIGLRDVQQRLAQVSQEVALDRRILDLAGRRVKAGTATGVDLLPLRRQVEDAAAAATPLTVQSDAYRNALAVLIGQAPGTLDAELAAGPPVPLPPARVAIGDPAGVIARRPDIRAAERTLAAQTAKIGVAEAARWPRISFTGLIGLGGSRPENVFDANSLSALALPRLAWNLLDFGRNAARVDSARGQRDEAEAQYRAAVLSALRDAEDGLSRFGASRIALASAARQRTLAGELLRAMRLRYRGGTARILDELEAERQQLIAERSVTAATAALSADYVALQKSLGLGWHQPD